MEQAAATRNPDKCTPDGGICCLDANGGTCGCWTSITTCLEGSSEVPSCSVDPLGCGSDTELAACN